MRFLIDAQLPRRLARWLAALGHDAVHAGPPRRQPYSRRQYQRLSILEERVVVTKDSDFVDTFLLRRTPHKLLLIATGNASNKDLMRLFEDNLQMIVDALEAVDFIELDGESITWRQ